MRPSSGRRLAPKIERRDTLKALLGLGLWLPVAGRAQANRQAVNAPPQENDVFVNQEGNVVFTGIDRSGPTTEYGLYEFQGGSAVPIVTRTQLGVTSGSLKIGRAHV